MSLEIMIIPVIEKIFHPDELVIKMDVFHFVARAADRKLSPKINNS